MHADADKICEGLTRIRRDLHRLGGAGAEYSRDVNRRVLEDCVGSRHGAEVTPSPREWHPWCWSDLAVLVDHLGCRIGGAARRVKERRRPIGERDAGPGRAIGLKVAEAVRYRLPHTVRINAGE